MLGRHVLPNAAIPILTVAGIQIARLLGGTVIVETIFGLPGIGRYVYEAIASATTRSCRASRSSSPRFSCWSA